MSSHLTQLQIDRMSGEEWLARGIAQGAPVPARLVEWDADTGLIYAVQSVEPASPVKIGYSHVWGLGERLKNLQTGNPYELRVLARAEGYLSSEQRAHRALRADRLTGEWFSWSPRVAAFVAALKAHGVERAIATANLPYLPSTPKAAT